VTYGTFSGGTAVEISIEGDGTLNTTGGYHVFDCTATNLVPGDNVLAVEVHDQTVSSPDIAFGLSVSGQLMRPPLMLDPLADVIVEQGSRSRLPSPPRASAWFTSGSETTARARSPIYRAPQVQPARCRRRHEPERTITACWCPCGGQRHQPGGSRHRVPDMTGLSLVSAVADGTLATVTFRSSWIRHPRFSQPTTPCAS